MRLNLKNNTLLRNEDAFTRLCFSKPARRLGNKTQMFGGGKYDVHLHNRLSHSLEVLSIATKLFNACKDYAKLDIFLLNSIAIAHDFGHTPFGHAGEYKLNSLIRNMLGPKINRSASFKHNINSVRILLDDEKIYDQSGSAFIKYKEFLSSEYDWRIFDGIINHTSTFNKKFSTCVGKDEYNIEYVLSLHPVFNNPDFQKLIIELSKKSFYENKFDGVCFNDEFSMNNFVDAYLYLNIPLSIEGMLVRIADEIAQRISDLSDIFEYVIKTNDKTVCGFILEFINNINLRADNLIKLKKNLKKNDCLDLFEQNRHRLCGSTIDLIKFCSNELKTINTDLRPEKKRHFQRVLKKIYDYFVMNESEYIALLMKNKNKSILPMSIDYKNTSVDYDLYLPININGRFLPLLDIEMEFVGFIDKELTNLSKRSYQSIDDIASNNKKGEECVETLFKAYSDNGNLQDFSTRFKVARNITEYLKIKDANTFDSTKINDNDSLETVISKIENVIDKDDEHLNKVYCLFFYGVASEISLYTNNICEEKSNKINKS